jgi:hypothetical protein
VIPNQLQRLGQISIHGLQHARFAHHHRLRRQQHVRRARRLLSHLALAHHRVQHAAALDGNWHHLVITYDIGTSTNNSTGGAATIYIDGSDGFTLTRATSAAASSTTYTSWGNPVRIGSTGRTNIAADQSGLQGGMDDVAVFSNQLTATQAKAVYNLALSTLDYGAVDADKLFTIFTDHVSRQTIDGQTWQFATGLLGAAGTVINDSAVVLDATAHTGVQLAPEPTSAVAFLALAGAAMVRRPRLKSRRRN